MYFLNDHTAIVDCLYIPEAYINIVKTPGLTVLEINPDIAPYSVQKILTSSEFSYRTRSVHNAHFFEYGLNVSKEDITNLIDSLKQGICNNKGNIVIGAIGLFALFYIIGALSEP